MHEAAIGSRSAGRDAFMAERMRQDAVIRKLEVIGEAVKQLSDETRQRRPEIPWKQIAALRDRLTPRSSASTSASSGPWSSATSTRATAVRALLSDDRA